MSESIKQATYDVGKHQAGKMQCRKASSRQHPMLNSGG
jgi:hypothetical protein